MPELQAGDVISVEIVWALTERYWLWTLSLPAGTTVGEALARWRQLPPVDGLAPDALAIEWGRVAVFSRPATPSTRLHEHDRVELLRPLLIDPMQARRQRAEKSPIGRRRKT